MLSNLHEFISEVGGSLDDTVENINLIPLRIGICLPAEDDIDCVVPSEVSDSKAYKVCYISI